MISAALDHSFAQTVFASAPPPRLPLEREIAALLTARPLPGALSDRVRRAPAPLQIPASLAPVVRRVLRAPQNAIGRSMRFKLVESIRRGSASVLPLRDAPPQTVFAVSIAAHVRQKFKFVVRVGGFDGRMLKGGRF